MPRSKIEEILAERQGKNAEPAEDTGKFYSVLSAEGLQENFLELRFHDGLKTCFAYADLSWFNYDPEAGTLDLEFGGFLVMISGRGLGERFFHSLKAKRVAWVKEADSDFQDNDANELYIKEILVIPPEGFTGEEEEATETEEESE